MKFLSRTDGSSGQWKMPFRSAVLFSCFLRPEKPHAPFCPAHPQKNFPDCRTNGGTVPSLKNSFPFCGKKLLFKTQTKLSFRKFLRKFSLLPRFQPYGMIIPFFSGDCQAFLSALSLFVALVLGTDYHDPAVSLDDFAFIAHRLYRRSNFHCFSP